MTIDCDRQPQVAEEEKTVYVPLGALQSLIRGARSQGDEERVLEHQLAEHRKRVQLLQAKTADVELTLAQYKKDHHVSMASPPSSARALPQQGQPPRSLSTTRRPVPPFPKPGVATQVDALAMAKSSPSPMRVVLTKERVSQLEEVMSSVKDISAQGEFEDVIARTLGAAQRLVTADKYTLGLLNERRNIVEVFSAGPRHVSAQRSPSKILPVKSSASPSELQPRQRIYSTFGIAPGPAKNIIEGVAAAAVYQAEGFVAADSATTFGRVIMTGKPLHIEDFYTHETYDDQIKSGSKGASPKALVCLPICNAHGAVVGVLQVVTMVKPFLSPPKAVGPETSPTPAATDVTATPQKTAAVFTDVDKHSLDFLAVVAGAAIWNLILFRERQTAQSRIEGLLKLHRNISMEAVSSTVLDQVLSVCHELIGTERIGLFMKVEGDEDELYIACAADIVRGEYVPITKGIVGHVARTGEMVITNDAYSHPMFDSTLDHKTGFVTKCILCLPVKSPDGHILAVLSAVNKIDNTDFSSEDAVFLKYAADAVGISLHKASLHHEVKTSQKLIEARLKLTTFISESTDIERFVDLVMEIGKDIMECDRFGFLLIDHFKRELWITPGVMGGGSESGIRTPMNRGISGLVATTGQPAWTRDAYKHELFDPSVDAKTGYRTTSVLCMPVFEDHATSTPKVVAVAMCINKKEGVHVVAFTKTDRDVMEKYCREVQFALGRLSLDISYYKVVYDCSSSSSSAAGGGSSGGSGGGGDVGTTAFDGLSEPDIISSIVHKYYNNGSNSSGDPSFADGAASKPTIASGVPALLKKKQEDDTIPFPREIVFPTIAGGEDPLDKWTTDTLTMGSIDIAVSCGVVFRAYGFLEAFRISSEKFAAFTTNVANYYRSNAFHNFQHAFQVLLTMHVMLRSECRKFFSGVEIFAMLLAALCHDIDHPGNTNDFELKTLSPMALTHNDDAVLERHHCRVTFIILNHKSAKILQHLDEARYKRVRQLIIYCILATDSAKHVEKCKALENLTRRQLNEKRSLLMEILMHAADLAFHALPFALANEWSNRLLDEFQHQAKMEADQGVPSDFFMQNLDKKKNRLVVQLNLINYVARPIWLPLTSLCHQLRFYADELEKNFEILQRQLEDCRAAEQLQIQQALVGVAASIVVKEVQQVPTSTTSTTSLAPSTPRSRSSSLVSTASEERSTASTPMAPGHHHPSLHHLHHGLK